MLNWFVFWLSYKNEATITAGIAPEIISIHSVFSAQAIGVFAQLQFTSVRRDIFQEYSHESWIK